MKRRTFCIIIALLCAVLFLEGREDSVRGSEPFPWQRQDLFIENQTGENLLVNGSMEEGFYWKYPNHFIANGWKRWWQGNVVPEYDDVRDWRPWRYDGHHAQIYFGYWEASYTAGIFQRIQVQPCTFYQFDMYGRNHSKAGADHHARIGIDPFGRSYSLYMTALPTDVVWSPEKTYFYEWGLHTVAAESLGDTITAITYVSPDVNHPPYDTFWDAGALFQTPFPNDRLPAPNSWQASDLITNVTSTQSLDTLTIEWTTAEPALSQIWYNVITPTRRSDPIGTLLLPSVYLPLVISSSSGEGTPADPTFTLATAPDSAYTTTHQATIMANLGQIVEFAILARRPVDEQCRTESSSVFQFKMVKPTPTPPPPP